MKMRIESSIWQSWRAY